jgi:hypothetical protein
VTTSPIPVEQFGDWLGGLLTAFESLNEQPADGDAPVEPVGGAAAVPFSFRPTSARGLQTISHSFQGSARSHRAGAKPFQNVNDSPTARAAARLRDQIIHNLGTR